MKSLFVAGIFILIGNAGRTQSVGIGTSSPQAAAQLDVSSTTKGLLLPRMTAVQRLAINPNAAARSLLVFDTDSSAFFFWSGSAWTKLNGTATAGPWTTDVGGNIFTATSGNVGIGTSGPNAYGHGGTNKILEIKNTGISANAQAQLILSSNAAVNGSIGGVTFVASGTSFADSRMAFIGAMYNTTTGGALQFWINNSGSLIPQASLSKGTFRVEGPTLANQGIASLSLGGYGEVQVDKPGVVGGRFIVKESGYVGIGTTNPNAPLSFPAALGKKITLYPGGSGNVGLAVYGNELRIHTDYEPADVTMGYENLQGNFTERFRFRGNGALMVNGNSGAAGQVLTSAGAGAPAVWTDKPRAIYFTRTGNSLNLEGTALCVSIPGIDGQTFTLNSPSVVTYQFLINLFGTSWPAASDGDIAILIEDVNSGNTVSNSTIDFYVGGLAAQGQTIIGVADLPAGNYRVKARITRYSPDHGNVGVNNGLGGNSSCGYTGLNPGQLVMQIFPK